MATTRLRINKKMQLKKGEGATKRVGKGQKKSCQRSPINYLISLLVVVLIVVGVFIKILLVIKVFLVEVLFLRLVITKKITIIFI